MFTLNTTGTFEIDRGGYMETVLAAYDEGAGRICFAWSVDIRGTSLNSDTALVQVRPDVLARALSIAETSEQAEVDTPTGGAFLDDTGDGEHLTFTAPCGDTVLVTTEDVRAILKAFAPQTLGDELPTLDDEMTEADATAAADKALADAQAVGVTLRELADAVDLSVSTVRRRIARVPQDA